MRYANMSKQTLTLADFDMMEFKNNRTIKKINREKNKKQIQHKLEVGLDIDFDFLFT